MKRQRNEVVITKHLVKIGVISICLFFTLEIVVDFWFTALYPGYSQINQSISRLGQVGSPIQGLVQLWGILFSVLIFLFGVAFNTRYKHLTWALSASVCLIIYGIGEGIGSSFLPLDLAGSPLTMTGHMHNIVSGLGDAGLVIFTLILLKIFPRQTHERFNLYVHLVLASGICLILMFLSVAVFKSDGLLSQYKGIWQRGYIYSFHFMLVVLGFKMLRRNISE